MVAPLIAIGAYELLVAGAAGTGAAALAIAKRKELAEGLSAVATTATAASANLVAKSLPWIMAPVIGRAPTIWRYDVTGGLDLNMDAIQPWAPPIYHSKDIAPSRPPLPLPVPLHRIGNGGAEPPPPTPDPRWRELLKVAQEGLSKTGDRIKLLAQNRWVQGAYTLYKWQTYGLAALSTAEIGRRMVVGGQVHGPILYDYIYEPIFGSSVAARTVLGGQQLMAAETTTGMLAIALAKHFVGNRFAGKLGDVFVTKFIEQLPNFGYIHALSILGNLTFFEHQITANAMSIENVDIDRAHRTAAFFGFTSILFYPLVGIVSNLQRISVGRLAITGVGRVGFNSWWARWGGSQLTQARQASDYGNWALAQLWHGAQRLLGPRISKVLAPHYVPRFRTFAIYAGFATVYRNVTQAIASLPWLEDSNWSESMAMTNARNVMSIALFDHYLYISAKGNSLRSIFGSQFAFMGLIWGLNQFFSPFDGKDVAVDEADRVLQKATALDNEGDAVSAAILHKPFTQRNFLVPPYTNLSVATWAQLSKRYMNNDQLSEASVDRLIMATQTLLLSKDQDERRVGMALGVLLSQVSFNPKWLTLKSELREAGVIISPSHANHPLSLQELHQVFKDINDGRYDQAPLFQFPLS